MMIYRAARNLSVVPKGSNERIRYAPGDVIPDFAEWGEVARRAHLNQNYVVMDIPPVTAADGALPPVEDPTKVKTKGKGKGKSKSAEAEPPATPPEPPAPAGGVDPFDLPDEGGYDPLLDPDGVLE